MPKAKRKQLNIGITPDQYEAVRIAAEEEGVTITVYCRQSIMEKGSAGAPRRDGIADVVDSLLAIHQQGQVTARIAKCLAGLLCSDVGLNWATCSPLDRCTYHRSSCRWGCKWCR